MCTESYQYYKQKNICVYCNKETALAGLVSCYKCNEHQEKQRNDQRKKKANNVLYKLELNAKTNAYNRQLYQQRKENGLCGRCGNRKPIEGRFTCSVCLIRKNRLREKSEISRNKRNGLGLCYTCGKPVYNNHKVCEEHYYHLLRMSAKAVSSPTEAMLAWRKRIKRDNNVYVFNGGKYE